MLVIDICAYVDHACAPEVQNQSAILHQFKTHAHTHAHTHTHTHVHTHIICSHAAAAGDLELTTTGMLVVDICGSRLCSQNQSAILHQFKTRAHRHIHTHVHTNTRTRAHIHVLLQLRETWSSPLLACWSLTYADHACAAEVQNQSAILHQFSTRAHTHIHTHVHTNTHARTHTRYAAAAGDLELTTTGMLVVDTVVPGSKTDGKLESGDILVKVQGQVSEVIGIFSWSIPAPFLVHSWSILVHPGQSAGAGEVNWYCFH